jgi:hypothetical protein|nr:MAG TPA: hypothetical protein [Caudoviricetes sp.]
MTWLVLDDARGRQRIFILYQDVKDPDILGENEFM